jgi:hypothetical protein
MATNNAIDLSAQGLAYYNGSGTFSSPSVTQYAPVIGAASNNVTTTAALTNGEILIGSTGTTPVPATLTAGSNVTITNGAGSVTIAATSSVPVPPLSLMNYAIIQEDFYGPGGSYQYQWQQLGTATNSSPSTAGHPGIIRTTTSISITNTGASLSTGGNPDEFVPGSGALSFRIGAMMSATNSPWSVQFGFADNPTSIANGVYFSFTSTTSSDWQCITRSSSTSTTTTTSTAGDTNWHDFYFSVNAGGTSVAFSIDGTVVATNTTRIPSVVLTPFFNIAGTGSTTNVILYVDYIEVIQALTTSR